MNHGAIRARCRPHGSGEPAAGRPKSTLVATAGDDNPYTALTGTDFAVDFNPVADRLRVIGSTGLDLRINVDSGGVITNGTIAPASGPAVVTAAAHTNAFAGTTTTQLYDIDAAAGLLLLQDAPNNGTLATGRPLGVTGVAANGFDIDPRSNAALSQIGGAGGRALIDLAIRFQAWMRSRTRPRAGYVESRP